MAYEEIIEELISEYELNSEFLTRRAYRKCFEYAKQKFEDPAAFNAFMEMVAMRLGQVPIRKDIVRPIVQSGGEERLHLGYESERGPLLSANQSGLIYLVKVLQELAETNQPGEHVHFDNGQPPLHGKSFPLTISYQSDEWFINGAKTQNSMAQEYPIPQRDINPARIKALVILQPLPPTFPMSRNKLYRVLSWKKLEGEKCWQKKIRELTERMYVFRFISDDNQQEEMAFDLDDSQVLFLTDSELEQITGKE